MFVPFWLFIVLSGFGCYGALVFINAIRNRKSKVVSPSAFAQQAKCAMLPCLGYLESECENCSNYNLYRKP